MAWSLILFECFSLFFAYFINAFHIFISETPFRMWFFIIDYLTFSFKVHWNLNLLILPLVLFCSLLLNILKVSCRVPQAIFLVRIFLRWARISWMNECFARFDFSWTSYLAYWTDNLFIRRILPGLFLVMRLRSCFFGCGSTTSKIFPLCRLLVFRHHGRQTS